MHTSKSSLFSLSFLIIFALVSAKAFGCPEDRRVYRQPQHNDCLANAERLKQQHIEAARHHREVAMNHIGPRINALEHSRNEQGRSKEEIRNRIEELNRLSSNRSAEADRTESRAREILFQAGQAYAASFTSENTPLHAQWLVSYCELEPSKMSIHYEDFRRETLHFTENENPIATGIFSLDPLALTDEFRQNTSLAICDILLKKTAPPLGTPPSLLEVLTSLDAQEELRKAQTSQAQAELARVKDSLSNHRQRVQEIRVDSNQIRSTSNSLAPQLAEKDQNIRQLTEEIESLRNEMNRNLEIAQREENELGPTEASRRYCYESPFWTCAPRDRDPPRGGRW